MYVIFGASGRVGGEVARVLLERGEPVRVVLRRADQGDRWLEAGAQVAIANLEDVGGVAAALQGASATFLFDPLPATDDLFSKADRSGATLAEALYWAEVPKAVILTSMGAQHASGTGAISTMYRFETRLRDAAPATAFVRAGYFFEDIEETARAAIADGSFPTFFEPALQVAMISAIDIGRACADLLLEDWAGQRIVELEGPEDVSADDIAAALTLSAARSVTPTMISAEEHAAMLEADETPPELAKAMLEMYAWVNAGMLSHEPGTERRRGSISLADFIERITSLP
ncbi:NAD(P)H-binding protein [Sphingopyxis sp.]|jgi:uncharacterized protein YbjT (DUF2867 family)|uniref:NmrA family NAD(P)-binding protein n=1 Tax=Sphingopyxis sp. TaxID=1908224 RepID=UPI002DF48B2F|nr:NAD(P)H-binding protein [Sphingopyxis sp.]